MKPNNFKHTMLTVGVIAALGISGTAANADISSGDGVSASNGKTITNTATATYKVDNITQPEVTSNEVTVNINEIGSFTLVAPQGDRANDDVNEDQKIAPGAAVTFKNILTNTGNVDDTYTITLADNNPNLIPNAEDQFDYKNLSTTPIKVVVKDSTGQPVSNDPDGTPYPDSITSGETIKLAPKHKATLTYEVTPDGNPNAGDSGIMQISATSTYIDANPKDGNKATVINEDQGIITKPIFSIVKSAATPNVDLNTQETIQYTITVTNENKDYSANATNIGIEDAIPEGLALKTETIKVLDSSDSAVSGYSTEGTNERTLKVSKIDLAKGESVKIKFTVQITDENKLAQEKSVTNNASVKDKFGPDDEDPFTDPDVTDSTNEDTDGSTNGVNDGKDDNNDEGSTVNFTDRGVDIESNNTKELPQTGSVTVSHTITNTGNEPEGDTAGEMFVTIKDPLPNDKIKPTGNITVKIYAKDAGPDADPIATQTVPVNEDGETRFDINDIYANGIPAGGTAVVSYTEESKDNANEKGEPKDFTNTNTVTVELKDPNNPEKIIASKANTDVFNIGTLKLTKEQKLDANCNDNVSADPNTAGFKKDTIDAQPDQCVIYRITAKNTFNNKELTEVVISDLKSNWSDTATYVDNSAAVSAEDATVSSTETKVTTSAFTIKPNSTVGLAFKIKIKTQLQ